MAKAGVGLDRDTIVATALRLLDEVGLDGLTLRRLAQELGVQAPALYWHVKNKQALLDLMAARIVLDSRVPPEPGPGQDWADWLAEGARDQRRRLLEHRDGARLLAGTRPLGVVFAVLDRMLTVLNRAGFTPTDGMRNIMTIGFYVAGFVQEEQAERARFREPSVDDNTHHDFIELLSGGRLPHVVMAFISGGDPNGEDSFEHGLGLLIDGMRAILARQDEPAPLVDAGEAARMARDLLVQWGVPGANGP